MVSLFSISQIAPRLFVTSSHEPIHQTRRLSGNVALSHDTFPDFIGVEKLPAGQNLGAARVIRLYYAYLDQGSNTRISYGTQGR